MSTLLDMNSHLTAVQILLSELHHDQSFFYTLLPSFEEFFSLIKLIILV